MAKPKNPLSLAPDPANPNRMDPEDKARMARSLAEFGDLSGIVWNKRTGLLIGGHQRTDVLRDGKLDVADLPEPEPDGTVARGHLEHGGRRYAVRVVDWPPEKAHAALQKCRLRYADPRRRKPRHVKRACTCDQDEAALHLRQAGGERCRR